ncbi:MAG: glycerol-3-phosphate acyltransferase [Dehalococcoidales bacterium]|nr:glycerol-3-phosphate acyltransferase [Dehalococcoidales bacterium]
MVNGIAALIIAYVLGSIPTAYLVTRFRIHKDIRTLGSGNVGAHNVYEHVGLPWAILTGIVDVAKGILAVVIAQSLVPEGIFWIMGAGLAVVIGHIWSVFLRFTGGNGIATTLGILLLLMTKEVGIAILVAILLITITRNLILSINIALLLTIPVAGSLIPHQNDPWIVYLAFSLILIAILVANFIPTMRAAMAKAGTKENMAAELMRIEKDKPEKKTKRPNKRKKK